MHIEEMRKMKKELGLTNEIIALRADVPLSTVQKIFAGVTASPRYETRMAIERVLEQEELSRQFDAQRPEDKVVYDYDEESGTWVKETEATYDLYRAREGGVRKRRRVKGERLFTVEDYYALPDDCRMELIDGKLYDLASPTVRHQKTVGFMFLAFSAELREGKHPCQVFLSPLDVRLDRDDFTMVEPDLFVLCNKKEDGKAKDEGDGDEDERYHTDRYIDGAPDFVMEVTSPSTKRRDLTLKVCKYADAGVSEYWIVDVDEEKVIVYDFRTDQSPNIYGFDAAVPVAISEGAFSIDFSALKEYLAI